MADPAGAGGRRPQTGSSDPASAAHAGSAADQQRSSMSNSQSSAEYERMRTAGAPPYELGGPPGYQSRTTVNAPTDAASLSSSLSPTDKRAMQLPLHEEASASSHGASNSYNHGSNMPFAPTQPLSQPLHGIMRAAGSHSGGGGSMSANAQAQAPRIAVTDPLADMRQRNLSKPEGLGAHSDWPTREHVSRSGGATPGSLSAAHTPVATATPMNRSPSGASAQSRAGVPPGGASPVAHFDGLPLDSSAGAGLPPGFVRPPLRRADSEMSSDDGNGPQDYDDTGSINWSDDEAVEESAKFEEEIAQQNKVKIGRISIWAILRFLGVTFLGNLIIGCLLIIPVLVIQFVYRPAQAVSEGDATHRAFVADNIQAWFIWAAFNLHIWWWLHFAVALVPRLAVVVVQLIWGTVNQKVKSYAEFYNAIKGFIAPITYAAMAWASWAILFNSIYHLYDHSNPQASRAHYLYRIYQVVEFFFFVTLTVCVEKIAIKCIAMSFHKSAYAERIEQVTKSLRTFDRLKDYRPKWKDTWGSRSGRATPLGFGSLSAPAGSQLPGGSAGATSRNNSPNTSTAALPLGGKRTHARKRPAMPMHETEPALKEGQQQQQQAGAEYPPSTMSGKRGMGARSARMLRNGASGFKTGAGRASKIARVALTDPFSLLSSKTTGVGADINSPHAAKRLAKTIFRSFRGANRRAYLIPSDFEPAFPTVQEARAAFAVFDRDGNGDISQSEIKNTVLATYKERRFLSKSMQDVNHAVGQLESIFYFIVVVILLFEAFAIFNVDISKTLTTFYTLGIAFAFIFKESAQNVFDSIIFLFVTHPFDTGDRIAITTSSGTTVVMAVKRMSLLSSEFTLADNTDMYVANAVLAAIMITNYRRSGYQWESIAIQVAFDTPWSKLDAVEEDMKHWLATEPERMFEPSTAIVPQQIDYMRSIELTVGMTHRRTWQDWGMRWYCRNAFFAALCFYLKKHGIRFAQPNQPIVYWLDDAAQLPPSYDDSSAVLSPVGEDAPGAGQAPFHRRSGSATSQAVPQSAGGGSGDAGAGADDLSNAGYYDDSFDPSPPASPAGDEAAPAGGLHAPGSTAVPSKPKSFMGFALPQDELDGMGMRKRKAKARRKALTTQGGDG